MWTLLLVTAIAIIAVLAFYAGKLLSQVKQQNINNAKAEKEVTAALQVHDGKALDSVVIIARAMLEGQCDLSEGCWRICVLLESLRLSSDLAQRFPPVYELYHLIKHMPILEERKKLPKKERMALDLERMKAESRLSDSILKSVADVLDYTNTQLTLLRDKSTRDD